MSRHLVHASLWSRFPQLLCALRLDIVLQVPKHGTERTKYQKSHAAHEPDVVLHALPARPQRSRASGRREALCNTRPGARLPPPAGLTTAVLYVGTVNERACLKSFFSYAVNTGPERARASRLALTASPPVPPRGRYFWASARCSSAWRLAAVCRRAAARVAGAVVRPPGARGRSER